MNIHFVCTGNVYRSRLAEAYLKSKQLPGIQVSSSGILAELDYPLNGPIFWGAMLLLQRDHLIPFMSKLATQTTIDVLNKSDLIIFMRGNHHEFSKKELGFVKENYEVWDIPDIDDIKPEEEKLKVVEVIDIAEKTFDMIKEKVDQLANRITSAGEVDQ